MRTVSEKATQNSSTSDTISSVAEGSASVGWTQPSYHEMADVPVVQQDALTQLQNNLSMLEDMQARLAFVMREVRYQLKF